MELQSEHIILLLVHSHSPSHVGQTSSHDHPVREPILLLPCQTH
jgi:hypothetical protein